jgi:hypothetical protein
VLAKPWRALLLGLAVAIAVTVGNATVARGATPTLDERLRVVVWVVTADDNALVERVRGQLSDLDLALEVHHGEAPLDASSARENFSGSKVLAVVWFQRPAPDADRVVVHAHEVATQRTSVREIGDALPTPDGALSSATLEATALVVREAVRAMAMRDAAPPPEPVAATPPPPEPPPSQRTARVSFRADFAWIAVFDGAEDGARHGPRLGLDARYQAFELGLFAGTTLPTEDEDAYGVIRLRRHVFGAHPGYAWRNRDGLALGVGLRAGIVLYARSTENPKANVTPTSGSVSPSLLVGPELRLGWSPASGPIELALSAGLDFVPSAPVIGYDVGGTFEPAQTIHRLQPVVGLGAAFHTARAP